MRHSDWSTILICLLLTGLLAGCGSARPDLERLYRFEKPPANQPPLILIHGFMGSKLRIMGTHNVLWPAATPRDAAKLALSIDRDTLLPMSSPVEAFELSGDDKHLALDSSIFQVLEDVGGYVRATPGEAVSDTTPRYYVFLYDWRQDQARSAAELAAAIAQIRIDHARPELKVDLVAHGSGGLVARWFIRYGTADVQDDNSFSPPMDGARSVRRAILLGTPNLGLITGVTAAIHGVDARGEPGGNVVLAPEVLATMPAIYQRFPHPVQGWLANPQGEILDIDVYEARLWQQFGWSVFDHSVAERVTAAQGPKHLSLLRDYFRRQTERARRFAWALSAQPRGEQVPYIVFGGACRATPTRLVVEMVGERDYLRLRPQDIHRRLPGIEYSQLMLEPGDGTTPKSSLLSRQALDPRVPRHKHLHFPLNYALFLCEGHELLTGNLHFHNNLMHALLSADEP